ncbi:MAG: hypothetical protein AB1689_10985, partial [Thermodesulfobacteriota bacterium]
ALAAGFVRPPASAEDAPGAAAAAPCGASGLRLAEGLSFEDDSSAAFPIVADRSGAGELSDRVPTVLFFGAAHCWNTNREAERVVALYQQHGGDACFLLIDLAHVSEEQRPLVRRFYRGAIPTIAVVDAAGRTVYAEAGETARRRGDTSTLEELLRRARATSP